MKITFSWDDNHKLNLKVADLFEDFGFRATFFINKDPTVNHLPPMEEDEIKNLFQRGFEIGAHTITHPILTEIRSNNILWDEINGSKTYLEHLLKTDIAGFCYPKGQFNDTVIRLVKSAGYRYARRVGEGSFSDSNNSYEIIPTIQIYNRLQRRYIRIRKRILNREPYSLSGDWKNSCLLFMEKASKKRDALIHVWGHSWEVDQQQLWKDLEDLLERIDNSRFTVVPNREAYIH